MSELRKIPLALVEAGDNDRKDFDPIALQELADSIAKNGLGQNPLYRPIAGGRFQIVAGERRTRACREILKWIYIEARVEEMSDEQAAAMMLAENMARYDLNPLEQAAAYRKRMETWKWSLEEVAQKAGKSVEHVRNRLKLQRLVPELQELIKKGQFPIRHAEVMVPGEERQLDNNRQRVALKLYRQSKAMPLQTFKLLVAELFAQQEQMAMFDMDALVLAYVPVNGEDKQRGKGARTGAPVSVKLPRVRYSPTDTVAAILDRYCADLLTAGKQKEAAAIGNVYAVLVAHNWLTIPPQAILPRVNGEADIILHEEKLER